MQDACHFAAKSVATNPKLPTLRQSWLRAWATFGFRSPNLWADVRLAVVTRLQFSPGLRQTSCGTALLCQSWQSLPFGVDPEKEWSSSCWSRGHVGSTFFESCSYSDGQCFLPKCGLLRLWRRRSAAFRQGSRHCRLMPLMIRFSSTGLVPLRGDPA